MSKDIFRPRHQPAQMLYDAFQKEAEKRDKRDFKEWSEAEIQAVWKAAREYAALHDLCIPTIEDVRYAEGYACGHVDYGAKWAYKLAEKMTKQEVMG